MGLVKTLQMAQLTLVAEHLPPAQLTQIQVFGNPELGIQPPKPKAVGAFL